ncbi:MAG TPA: phosphoribosylanthranilate isomerase [Crinalium sp.]|jgi:phosphoribosylanthranilate isomerase
MRIKICGITKPDQGRAIAQLGATALGFMCVERSPRYVLPEQIRVMVDALPVVPDTDQPAVDCVGVFADASLTEIQQVIAIARLTAVQLHGNETPEFCQELRETIPQVELIKALRIRDAAALEQVNLYRKWVDTLLLDAYHPQLLGGTGKTLDWPMLQQFSPGIPWILAGGLKPDNVAIALQQLNPDGLDLSSGVESAPGDKDLSKVAQLFEELRQVAGRSSVGAAELEC